MRWQLSLGSKKLSLTDLVYDSTRYLITSLSGNSIDTATVRGYLHSHWNPSLSSDAQIASNTKNGKQLIISQLILQVKRVPKETSNLIDPFSPSRIAVGCFIDSSVENTLSGNPSSLISSSSKESENVLLKCGETAILSVVLPAKLVVHSDIPLSDKLPDISLKLFTALSDISVNALRVAISSDDSSNYSINDIIFGISSPLIDKQQQPKISVLNLSDNKVTTLELPSDAAINSEINSNETDISSSYIASLLLKSELNEFHPVIVYCNNALSCTSYYITHTVSNSKNVKNTKSSKSDLKINLLDSCTGVDSILGVERYPEGSSIGMSISCAIKESSYSNAKRNEKNNEKEKICSNLDLSCSEKFSSLQISSSSLSNDEEHSVSVLSSKMIVSLPGDTDSSTLLFLSSEIVKSNTDMNNSLRAIIVYSSMLTVSYQSTLPSASSLLSTSSAVSGVETWRREEYMSRVKQAVILEDSRNFDSSSLTHTVEGEDEAPGFSKRLLMQFDEIQVNYF